MKAVIVLASLLACWVVFVTVREAVDGIQHFKGYVTCEQFVEEDGSISPVMTDFDASRCLAQRGIDGKGWFAQEQPAK